MIFLTYYVHITDTKDKQNPNQTVLNKGLDPDDKVQTTIYYLDVNSLVDLPNLNQKSDKTTDNDNSVGLIIHNIKKNNNRLENIEEYRSHRQAFQGLSASPELYV